MIWRKVGDGEDGEMIGKQ